MVWDVQTGSTTIDGSEEVVYAVWLTQHQVRAVSQTLAQSAAALTIVDVEPAIVSSKDERAYSRLL